SLTNTAATLTVTGVSQAGGGSVTISNTGAITVTGQINAGSSAPVTLTAGGVVSESGSGQILNNGLLTTSSVGGTALGAANNQFFSFNATNTTSGNVSVSDNAPLTITGISQSGGGSVTVNSFVIGITGTVGAGSGGAVTLTATAGLQESGAG